jgi:hypothetical protein
MASPGGNVIEIFDAPGAAAGAKLETLTIAQAAARPDLAVAAKLAPGAIGVIFGGGFHWGHWEEHDIAVPFISLTNGDETTALLLSPAGSAWPSGDYKLHAVLDAPAG